jgi:hypothetical protein
MVPVHSADDRACEHAAQDAVRRILKDRRPEKLPSGSKARLRKRIDDEQAARTATRPTRKTVAKKKKTVR